MKLEYSTLLLTILSLVPKGAFTSSTSTSSTCPANYAENGTIDDDDSKPPFVHPFSIVGNKVLPVYTNNDDQPECWPAERDGWHPRDAVESLSVEKLLTVHGCCTRSRATAADNSDGGGDEDDNMATVPIGKMPQMTREESLERLQWAKSAWNHGGGTWTQLSLKERIERIEDVFLSKLAQKRDRIVKVLMWEIGKNRKDAEAEFDRTVDFIKQTIKTIRTSEDFQYSFQSISSTKAYIRRNAIGIILCLGPFNYPLNETYAAIIPALLMGNVIIMKIPSVGGLAHFLTMEAFAEALPPNTIQFISGSGRATMPPMMETGDIDGLAFIGGSKAADDLINVHPHPHRLKLFLQLEAKNMGILMNDLFEEFDTDDNYSISHSLDDIVTGALSYNGQRCTAIKIVFAPKGQGEKVAKELSNRVEMLSCGLPWEKSLDGKYSQITPLPNMKRVEYMKGLINDAIAKGANVMNPDGGKVLGSTLMVPAVVYPVTANMDLYSEEQFGPIIPIVEYDTTDDLIQYGQESNYGQQVAIFTRLGGKDVATLVDNFSSIFGKININSQCGRSPDTLPFTGRRSSALGAMSVLDALKEFSVATVVAYKENKQNYGPMSKIVQENIATHSKFMSDL